MSKLKSIIATDEAQMLKMYTLLLDSIKFLEALYNRFELILIDRQSSEDPSLSVAEATELRDQIEGF